MAVGALLRHLQPPFPARGISIDQVPDTVVIGPDEMLGDLGVPMGIAQTARLLGSVLHSYDYGLAPLRSWPGASATVARWDALRAELRLDQDTLLRDVFGIDLDAPDWELYLLDAFYELEHLATEVAGVLEQAMAELPEACLRQLLDELARTHDDAAYLLSLVQEMNQAQPFVAFVAGILGGADAPTRDLAFYSRVEQTELRLLVQARDFAAALPKALEAIRAVNTFAVAVQLYKEDLQAGAGVAVRILDQTVSIAVTIVAALATGGSAALLPNVLATGVGGAVRTGIDQLVYGRQFDMGEIGSAFLRDAFITGMTHRIGLDIEGTLGRHLVRVTPHHQALAAYLTSAGTAPLEHALEAAIASFGDREVGVDDLFERVASNLATAWANRAAGAP